MATITCHRCGQPIKRGEYKMKVGPPDERLWVHRYAARCRAAETLVEENAAMAHAPSDWIINKRPWSGKRYCAYCSRETQHGSYNLKYTGDTYHGCLECGYQPRTLRWDMEKGEK